jgi:hypothetical protein
MKKQLNEVKRMQQLAGVIKESKLHEANTPDWNNLFDQLLGLESYLKNNLNDPENKEFASKLIGFNLNFKDYLNKKNLYEIEGLDDFVSSLRAGNNKGFVIATDEDNDFEIDDEIRDILKKNGADENNFQIISKVNFDNLAGDQLKDMQDKLIIRKRK